MKLLLSIILAIGVIGGSLWLFLDKPAPQPEPPVPLEQTQEVSEYDDWTATTTNDVSFKYPQFSKSYISVVEWPPKIEKQTESLSCKGDAGTEIKEAEIDGVRYCVIMSTEGAAGSTFKTYTYKREGLEATFSLRFPQCLNYDELQQDECLKEQERFSPDTLIHKVFSTVSG
jgi:hypothetical protein